MGRVVGGGCVLVTVTLKEFQKLVIEEKLSAKV